MKPNKSSAPSRISRKSTTRCGNENPPRLQRLLAAQARTSCELVRKSEAVILSAVVYGFRHGNRYEQNFRDLHVFLDNPYVTFVPISLVTADPYSRVAASLRAKGRPCTDELHLSAES